MPSDEFTVKLEDEGQIKAALLSNGAAFQGQGGAPLMLTEAVENGNDAIDENRRHFNFNGVGEIKVVIQKKKKVIMVIDNGTGMRRPVYISEHPFKSLKTGANYVGQFGRGLWGFWGFCRELTYITRRHLPEKEETERGHTSPTIKLMFERESIKVKYDEVADSNFDQYCAHKTGTVAVYSGWLTDDFDNSVVRDLRQRLQHHFSELIRYGKVDIMVQVDDQLPEGIAPKDFDPVDRYSIPVVDVKDDAGNTVGKLEFFLYKDSPRSTDRFKKPYLLVGDRPLQDSFIGLFPEFDDQPVWTSPYVKGFVKADFVKPNPLRTAPEVGPSKDLLVKYLRAAAPDIEEHVNSFRRSLSVAQDKQTFTNIALDVQSFLLGKKGMFNFEALKDAGMLTVGQGSSVAGVGQRGGEKVDMVDENGSRVETILVARRKKAGAGGQRKGGGAENVPRGGSLPGTDMTRDGSSEMEVKMTTDPTVRKHVKGRKTKRGPVGPGCEPEANEFSDEISWYLDDKQAVIINTEHRSYKSLMDLATTHGGVNDSSNRFIKMRDALVSEQYMLQLVKRFSGLDGDDAIRAWMDLKYEYARSR